MRHAFAVTTDGHLYSWGSNDYSALGATGKESNFIQFVPKLVECLKDKWVVKKVACGDYHNLVYAKKIRNGKESEGSNVLAFGKAGGNDNNYLGLTED